MVRKHWYNQHQSLIHNLKIPEIKKYERKLREMKKFLVLLLVLVIGMTAGIGGTVAYLIDTEEAVNVMTVGNVEIAQHEYQRAEGVAYNAGEAGKGNGVMLS